MIQYTYFLKAVKKYRTSPILNIQKKKKQTAKSSSSSTHSDRQSHTVFVLYSHPHADSKASKGTAKQNKKHHSDRNVALGTVKLKDSRQ